MLGGSQRRGVLARRAALGVAVVVCIAAARADAQEAEATWAVRVGWEGASPEEVEAGITAPLRRAIGDDAGLRVLASASRASEAALLVEGDGLRLRALVALDALPADSEAPTLRRLARAGAVRAPARPAPAPHDADASPSPEHSATLPHGPGAATAGGPEQLAVDIDVERLAAYGLTPRGVEQALRAALVDPPGGSLEPGGTRRLLEPLRAIPTPEDVAAIVIAVRGGVPVRIADVARLEVSRAPSRGPRPRFAAVVRVSAADTDGLRQAMGHVHERLQASLPDARLTGVPEERPEVQVEADPAALARHSVTRAALAAALRDARGGDRVVASGKRPVVLRVPSTAVGPDLVLAIDGVGLLPLAELAALRVVPVWDAVLRGAEGVRLGYLLLDGADVSAAASALRDALEEPGLPAASTVTLWPTAALSLEDRWLLGFTP